MTAYKLTETGNKELEDFIFEKDREMWAFLNPENKSLVVKYKENNSESLSKKNFAIEEITDDKSIENQSKYLQEEYVAGHEWGKHWDLLRWNWSKFFLSIETVMVVIAAKGILAIFERLPSENTLKFQAVLLAGGLTVLSLVNIFLCVVWATRNLGIHKWHCNSIRRLKIIEFDPRLQLASSFYNTITRRLHKPPHKTGALESWAPPVAFGALWISVLLIILCILYSFRL